MRDKAVKALERYLHGAHDIDDLEDLLLIHFRSRQFSSFQRQLNYFSFRKVGKQGYESVKM